jgi:hypothetical protein
MFDLGARRVLAKIVIAVPILRWSDWPGHKTSTAVRTNVAQDNVYTSGTECTFISTDARLKRLRRQWLVAVLTGWSGSSIKWLS